MPTFEIDSDNALFYLHTPPAAPEGMTFVFFNALTGDTGMWEGAIGSCLRQAGHGTLSFNFRGQTGSPFAPGTRLDAPRMVEDARRLLTALAPQNIVLTGLSIGGLFAAQAWLAGLGGLKVRGLVLINTLRSDGPRLRWVNDALVRCAEVGGLTLFRDLYAPLLFNQDWLAANRANFLKPGPYQPLAPDSGHYQLLANAGSADWDLPYEDLALPVLVITGLQDHVFLDQDDVNRLFARLPEARRLNMADAAHLLPAERPEALASALLDFAREC
jgi:pimeloyl-ACP methyl ester carboxylesterase